MLAGAVAQLERFLPVVFRKFALSQVVVDRAQAGIGHGEIGVEFYRALVERQSGQFVEHLVLHVAQAEGLERFER